MIIIPNVSVSVPLLGQLKAGVPIEVDCDNPHLAELIQALLGKRYVRIGGSDDRRPVDRPDSAAGPGSLPYAGVAGPLASESETVDGTGPHQPVEEGSGGASGGTAAGTADH